MPDVGVLQLTIQDNSSEAAKGLGKLAGALTRVQNAVGGMQGLENVSTHINSLARAVTSIGNLDAVKKITDLGKAMKSLTEASNMKSIKFDTKGITALKKAIGDGMHLGQAGTQLKNIRSAMEEFQGGGADGGKTNGFIESIRELKTELGSGDSGLAGSIKELSAAMREYGEAASGIKTSDGAFKQVAQTIKETTAVQNKAKDGVVDYTKVMEDYAATVDEQKITFKEPTGGMKLNLQMFGGRGGSATSGNWRDEMSGIQEVNDALRETDTSGVNNIKELSAALRELGKVSGGQNLTEFSKGLRDIASACESGAKSYHTLTYLATALTKVKTASSGFKLPDFSRLERLAQVLQENFNAENGLTRLAKGMEAMKAASAGFKMPSTKDIEKIINVMNGASATGASTPAGSGQFAAVDGLKQVEETVQQAETGLSVMNGELANTYKIIDGNDFDNGAKAFQETFEAFDSLRSSHALESGGSAELSVGVFDSLRQDAIEVEGTVSEAYDGVRYKALEAGEAFTEAGSAMNAMIPYGYDLEQSWEHMNKLANEAYQKWKDSRISGYGTIGSIRDLYASTDLRGEDAPGVALRGDKGYEAKIEARNQIAEITGMPIDEINKQLVQLGEDARKANANVRELVDSLNKPMDWGNLSQGIDRMQGIGTEAKSAEDSMRAFLENMGNGSAHGQQLQADNPELAQFKQTMEETGVAAKDFTSKLVDVDGELKSKKKDAADASSGFLGLKETFNDLKKAMSTTVFGKLAKQFANIAKRMAIRAVIRQVTAAFKEGTENVYKYNEAIGGSFASDMDSAATSLLQMKNAIGAAVAPAIQAAIPYLNQLISAFINAINYVNQFFSLLQGKSTWTRALPYATKAFEDQKKAAKGASSAMKDLLADWDELNIIQSESGGGGGGAAAKDQTDYTQMFEEVNQFDSTVSQIASFVKELIDFVKENLVSILGVVTAIKWGARLAKFSSAFTGVLGDVLGLAAAGFIIKLTIDAVSTLDNKFFETGNPGYLVADTLTTLVGGFFAKKVLGKVLGGSLAKIAIPLTFAISAGATISALVQNTDVSALSEKGILASLNAALKGGIASGSAAFSLAGWSAAKALGMGVAGAAFTFGLSIGIKAISETVNMGEITSSVIESDLTAAASIGAGLAIGAAVLGGTIGTIVAAGVGGALFTFALLVGIEALIAKDAPKKVMYGDVELTDEEVQKFVEDKMFSININATIDNINATVANKKQLETQVQTALTNSGADFNLIKLGIAKDDDYAQLKNDILGEDGNGGLVGAVNKYIDEAKAMGKLTLSLTPELVGSTTQDASEWFTTYTTGWDLVDKFVKDKGAEIGKLLTTEEGKKIIESTPEVLAALMQQVSDVTNAITGAQISSEAFANLNLNIGDLSETSLDKVMTAYESYIDQLTAKERELAIQQYTSQGELVAGLIAMGADPNKDPLKSALEEYEYMGDHINDAVEKSVNRASKPGREMIKKYFAELFNVEAPDIKTNAPMVMQMVNSLGISLREGLDESTIENDLNNLLENILSTTFSAEDFKFIKQAVDLGAMNYIDFFDNDTLEYILSQFSDEEYKDKIRSAWEKMVQESFGEAEPVTVETKTEVENTVKETTKYETTTVDIEESPAVKEAEEAVEKVNEISQEAHEAKKGILTLDDVKFDTSGVTSSADAAASSIEDMARRIRDAFATLDGLSYEMDINGAKYSGAMSVLIPKIEQKASGGFVRSGDLVMANENGQFEMMGRMGNQPVVANNQQIVNGISQGVTQANSGVEARLGAIETMLTRILQKEFVARAVPSSGWGQHGVQSTEAWNKVTG